MSKRFHSVKPRRTYLNFPTMGYSAAVFCMLMLTCNLDLAHAITQFTPCSTNNLRVSSGPNLSCAQKSENCRQRVSNAHERCYQKITDGIFDCIALGELLGANTDGCYEGTQDRYDQCDTIERYDNWQCLEDLLECIANRQEPRKLPCGEQIGGELN